MCWEVLKNTIKEPVTNPEIRVKITADLCFINSVVPEIKIAVENFFL